MMFEWKSLLSGWCIGRRRRRRRRHQSTFAFRPLLLHFWLLQTDQNVIDVPVHLQLWKFNLPHSAIRDHHFICSILCRGNEIELPCSKAIASQHACKLNNSRNINVRNVLIPNGYVLALSLLFGGTINFCVYQSCLRKFSKNSELPRNISLIKIFLNSHIPNFLPAFHMWCMYML